MTHVEDQERTFSEITRTLLNQRRVDGFQLPIKPTPEEPSRYHRWIYGIEEIASHLEVSLEEVENFEMNDAQRGGYRHPEDLIAADRILAHLEPDRLKSFILSKS